MSLSYSQTLDYLYNRLPVFHKIGKAAYKKDLTNTLLLLEAIGNPHLKLKCVHIAGTNGKGSVSSLLHSFFVENGYRCGLYTSPHLLDFKERIRINTDNITEAFVIDFVARTKLAIEKIDPSFFEVTVAMAFDYFASQNLDICIIEAGLGGRLDSTNVIQPLLSIITNIGFDHTDILGDTLEKIATEKAGIIKQNTPVVVGEYLNETKTVFENTALEKQAQLNFALPAPTHWIEQCALKGKYQIKNLSTVYTALQQLENHFQFDAKFTDLALKNVKENSGLRGRWEVLSQQPFIVADTAHNADGLKYTIEQFTDIPHAQIHFILGFVNDKDLNKVLPLFPKNANYYFTKPSVFRGLDASILKESAEAYGLLGETFDEVKTAFNLVSKSLSANDILYIGGSTFVVADLLS